VQDFCEDGYIDEDYTMRFWYNGGIVEPDSRLTGARYEYTFAARSSGSDKEERRLFPRTLYLVMGAAMLLVIAVAATIALQNRQTAANATPGRDPAQPATGVATGVGADGFFFKGNADAPVIVTEFSDYQCPGCAYYAMVLAAQFEQEYIATGRGPVCVP
jgi:protein-disulfide isomerase